ncbi:patatin-like phospholipase family protein [uncultured Ruegeria sp.]|uniref:patatin-like phospholipase family protein n=1 Tax=uncultured Ruegeria sp. TaxID=259304 RepID=UPI00262506A8|nr:patatin-like phospholipase family protein [uncultured Ruegeria sp.]
MSIRRLLVSLSGGGYRAALFNAGVLRTLNEKRYLDHIHDDGPQNVVVNAVSGGSIPAALWSRFLRSSEYESNPAELHPERELIRLVTSSPSLFGRFNWHAKGFVIGAQKSWYKHLLRWWDSIPWTAHNYKHFLDKNGDISAAFLVPGTSQYFPAFLTETLDFNTGEIFLFFENEYFRPNLVFFKNGDRGYKRDKYPHPHGIVSATAFPVFFPSVKLGGWTLMDAGLIDNQGILGFLPLLSFKSNILLGEDDVWYLSDAGRSMAIAGGYQDEYGAGNKPVRRLTLADRVFRLTGDLSQPIVVQAITNLISNGLKTSVVGVKMDVTSHDKGLWVEGERIRSPQQSAQVETSLSSMAHSDAAAIIAHGAQCATLAFGLEQSKKDDLVRRLSSLATE